VRRPEADGGRPAAIAEIAALLLIGPDFGARRVLVTGHTGFRAPGCPCGCSPWELMSRVSARDAPTRPSRCSRLARVGDTTQHPADVRDAQAVRGRVRACEPEIVSPPRRPADGEALLREPALTYEVNVMGTVNVLDAVRRAGAGARAVVVVTSDKCYENDGMARDGFLEGDPLGGRDPYSSSKACAELVCAAYRRSFFGAEEAPALATARAGNVIGGATGRGLPAGRRPRRRGRDADAPAKPGCVGPGARAECARGYLLSPGPGEPPSSRGVELRPPAGEARTVARVVERLASPGSPGAGSATSARRRPRPPSRRWTPRPLNASWGGAPGGSERSLELIVAWHRGISRARICVR
jgi:CDP-glucose 4,6-dehydratase